MKHRNLHSQTLEYPHLPIPHSTHYQTVPMKFQTGTLKHPQPPDPEPTVHSSAGLLHPAQTSQLTPSSLPTLIPTVHKTVGQPLQTRTLALSMKNETHQTQMLALPQMKVPSSNHLHPVGLRHQTQTLVLPMEHQNL
mmetsp:Transcript_56337/g.132766  ORF Transcript_56337/g.132766 Transcript_56337/m.132766 type:complete len:137 (-) Transcript_56337:383-793(-)